MSAMSSHIKRRNKYIAAFGGKCQRCGYDRCQRALQFHHKDSSEKKMWSGKYPRASFDEIEAHPERFILLCANCHFEEHDRLAEADHMYTKCAICGTPIRTSKHIKKIGKDKFCSRECHIIHRKSLEIIRDPEGDIVRKFWQNTTKTETCWLWGGITCLNYPAISYVQENGKGSMVLARRVSFELHKHKLRDGQKLRMKCETPLCVNPDHIVIHVRRNARLLAKGPAARGQGELF